MLSQEQKVFKALLDTVDTCNISNVKDIYGNELITFNFADDVAITFAVDDAGTVKGVWYNE